MLEPKVNQSRSLEPTGRWPTEAVGTRRLSRSAAAMSGLTLLLCALSPLLAGGTVVRVGTNSLSLELGTQSAAVTAVLAGRKAVGTAGVGGATGFLVEDYAASTVPEQARGTVTKTENGLALDAEANRAAVRILAQFTTKGDVLHISGTVTDKTGSDRAIVLSFRLPVDVSGKHWSWDDDILTKRPADREGVYQNIHKLNYDHIEKSRWVSRYPVCALHTESVGLSAAVPLDPPRVCILRFAREKDAGFLELCWELGLSAETAKFPSRASFSFVLYPHDPKWGFRSALQRYYALYPESFRTRVKQQGLWYINTDPEALDYPWDFHFMFDEVATLRPAKVLFNNLYRYYAFHYVEPWGRWHFFGAHPVAKRAHSPEDVGVDPDDLTQRFLTSDLARTRPDIADWIRRSAAYGSDGKWFWMRWFDVYRAGDWTSFILTINDPDVPGGHGEANLRGVDDAFALKCFPGGQAEWARQQGLRVDGIYLDSIGGWSGFMPDSFRRDLWKYADVPLLFDHTTKQPVQNHAMGNWEFVKELSLRLRKQGKLLMANMHPPVDVFFFPLMDAIGAEAGGESFTSPPARRAYMRTHAYHKPVSWLDYNDNGYTDAKVPLERKEWAMQRNLPYALFPGTGNFWESNREGYEPARPLYRKYLPIFEELAAAGWEPVPHASCQPAEDMVVERFGHLSRGAVYVVVANDRGHPVGNLVLRVSAAPLGLPANRPARGLFVHELVADWEATPTEWRAGSVTCQLSFTRPWQTQVLRFATPAYLMCLHAGRALRAAQDAKALLIWKSRPHANEGRMAHTTGKPLDPEDTEARRQQVTAMMERLKVEQWVWPMQSAEAVCSQAALTAAEKECRRLRSALEAEEVGSLREALTERCEAAARELRRAREWCETRHSRG